jgi:hypothetical protein
LLAYGYGHALVLFGAVVLVLIVGFFVVAAVTGIVQGASEGEDRRTEAGGRTQGGRGPRAMREESAPAKSAPYDPERFILVPVALFQTVDGGGSSSRRDDEGHVGHGSRTPASPEDGWSRRGRRRKMNHAQLEIWPTEQRDEWDVLTATVDGVVWRRYSDRRIVVTGRPGELPHAEATRTD